MDVIFYEVFAEEESALRGFLPADVKAGFTAKTIQGQGDRRPPAAFLSIRTQSQIPSDWDRQIKGILTRSQGYDHLNAFRRAAKHNIAYGYLGHYCSRAVAEHAVLTMMVLLRKLKKQIHCFDIFARDGLTGVECRGRRALVIGVGHIGSEIIDMVEGLKMTVKGVDIVQKLPNFEYVSLTEGISWADVIFCSASLTPQTRGMLNYDLLQRAKAGAIVINVARGEISPIRDLKKLLEEGILGGLSLDVYSEEDVLADALRGHGQASHRCVRDVLELKDRDNVLFTPHNAFNTQEALMRKASLSAEAVVSFLKKGTFPCPVPAEGEARLGRPAE